MPKHSVRARVLSALRDYDDETNADEPLPTASEIARRIQAPRGAVLQALFGLEGEGLATRFVSRVCFPTCARWGA